MTGLDWRAWAPPIDPPTAGGLPEAEAQLIADAWWDDDPHEAAALMWEAYAALLPPAPAVAQVATGSQSVCYSPPLPGRRLRPGGRPRRVAPVVPRHAAHRAALVAR